MIVIANNELVTKKTKIDFPSNLPLILKKANHLFRKSGQKKMATLPFINEPEDMPDEFVEFAMTLPEGNKWVGFKETNQSTDRAPRHGLGIYGLPQCGPAGNTVYAVPVDDTNHAIAVAATTSKRHRFAVDTLGRNQVIVHRNNACSLCFRYHSDIDACEGCDNFTFCSLGCVVQHCHDCQQSSNDYLSCDALLDQRVGREGADMLLLENFIPFV